MTRRTAIIILFLLLPVLPGSVYGEDRRDPARLRLLTDEAVAAGTSESRRDELADEILGAGKQGRKRLRKAVRRKFRDGYRVYLKEFRDMSERLTQERRSGLDPEELDRRRTRVLEIGLAEESTGDIIRSACDPLFLSLAESTTVHPIEVLGSSGDLREQQAHLRSLLNLWWRLDPEDSRLDPSFLLDEMRRDEMFAAMLGWDLNRRDRSILVRNHSFLPHTDRKEFEAVRLLNAIRLTLGLPTLALDTRLARAGRRHSRDMAENGFHGHDSPVVSRQTPLERAGHAGTTASGENIAIGPPTAEDVIDAWWHSPSHHRLMLGTHTRVGIGRHDRYWTMMLGQQPLPRFEEPEEPIRVFDPPARTGRTGGGRTGGSTGSGGSGSGGESVADPIGSSGKSSRDD
jgi:hypothetical protein